MLLRVVDIIFHFFVSATTHTFQKGYCILYEYHTRYSKVQYSYYDSVHPPVLTY
jgi:hypothetical protein